MGVRIIGLDPGKASGLVLWEDGEVVEWAELNQKDTVFWLVERLRSEAVDILVCESWKPRGGAHAFQPFSLELIGFARGLSWLFGSRFLLQDPAIKVRLHDRAVKEFPEVGRGGGGHARDAMAHVLFCIQTHKHTWET